MNGKNILAILVWHLGKSGFSHLSSNLGGLRCAIALPEGVLSTDSSWMGNCYYCSTDSGLPDDRANALAVLSGLAKAEYYPEILAVLESTENSSPYMEKYVLDAMCEMGYIDDAIFRMKRRYREMVEEDYSTLWEYWNKDGTKNHAWSGGPLVTMAKYIAGIRPAAVGYEKLSIKPHLGYMKYLKCQVPSVRGEIVVEIGNK